MKPKNKKTFFSPYKGAVGPWGVSEGGLPDHVESRNFLGGLILARLIENRGYILKSHVSYGTGPIGTSELYMGPVP